MKILVVGASGAVGKNIVEAFRGSPHEIIKVGKTSGDFQVKIEDPSSVASLYKKIGSFDAVACASGEVAFTPLQKITREQWLNSLQSKLLGQINLVEQALPYISEGGAFALISGILGDEQILAGTVAATVNSALEGYVRSAVYELPKRLRINLISPALLTESAKDYGDFFPGFTTVDGPKVGQAFKKALLGIQTGKVFRVY